MHLHFLTEQKIHMNDTMNICHQVTIAGCVNKKGYLFPMQYSREIFIKKDFIFWIRLKYNYSEIPQHIPAPKYLDARNFEGLHAIRSQVIH